MRTSGLRLDARHSSLPRKRVPFGFHLHAVERRAGRHVKRLVLLAAERAVGRLLGELDDAQHLSLRIEDLQAQTRR